jgi:hypothetical protein
MPRTVKFEFDPFEGKPTPKEKRAALDEISFLVYAEILRKVSEGTSPVAGHGKFKKLNKEYAKSQKGGNTLPNLELTGDMLSSLDVRPVAGKIRIQIKGKEGDKADGHNNHSGESKLPTRRFIPADDEFFSRDIERSINEIISQYEEK